MRARFLVPFVSAVLALATACAALGTPLDDARAALAAGEIDSARRILQDYLASNPSREDAGEALYLLGSATLDAAQCFQIDTKLLDGYRNHPRAVDAALRAGRYLYATGDYERAANMFNDLVHGKDPRGRSVGALWLGTTLLALGDVGPAREQFRMAGETPELAAQARLGEGDTFRAEAKLQEALRRYAAAADERDSPWRAAALLKCAVAARDLGDSEEAARYVARLEADAPESPEAAMALVLLAPSTEPAESPAESTAAAPAESTAGVEGASYSVQVGAFSDRENAARLHSEIGGLGFPDPRIVPDLRSGAVVYGVRFGHYASRASAEAAGSELAGSAGLRFMVIEEGEPGAVDTTAAAPDSE